MGFAGRVRVNRRVRFIYHPRPPREVQANRIPTPPTCPLQFGATPVYMAALRGHTDVIDTLVKHGANVNTANQVAPPRYNPPCLMALTHIRRPNPVWRTGGGLRVRLEHVG